MRVGGLRLREAMRRLKVDSSLTFEFEFEFKFKFEFELEFLSI